MGFRWRKSFRVLPGFRINLSHRGARGQVGGSPLSFSFRLFGGSKQRRLTASLPGTGLSFVGVSSPGPAPAAVHEPADASALLREAFAQAAQFRLIPVAFDEIARQPADTRREIARAAMPIFIRLMTASGRERSPDGLGPEAIDALPIGKLDALISEVTGVEPCRLRYPSARLPPLSPRA